MKPTQEQILQWAREAGFHKYASDFQEMFEALATLAYEAGRKDENEACAKVCDEIGWKYGFDAAFAIRARRGNDHG